MARISKAKKTPQGLSSPDTQGIWRMEPDGSILFTRVQEPYPLKPGCRYLINVGVAPQVCLLYDT